MLQTMAARRMVHRGPAAVRWDGSTSTEYGGHALLMALWSLVLVHRAPTGHGGTPMIVYVAGWGSQPTMSENAARWEPDHYFGGYTLGDVPDLLDEIATLRPALIVGHSLGASVAWLAAQLCAPGAVICTSPALALWQPAHRLQMARRGAVRLALAATRHRIPELPPLEPLRCPALLVTARHDKLIPWRLVAWQAARLGADLLRLDDGDHNIIHHGHRWLRGITHARI